MSNLAAALGEIDHRLQSVSERIISANSNQARLGLKSEFDRLLAEKDKLLKKHKSLAKSMVTRKKTQNKEKAMNKLKQFRHSKISFAQSMSRKARAAAREARKIQNQPEMDVAAEERAIMGSRSRSHGPVFSRQSKSVRKHPYRNTNKSKSPKKFVSWKAHLAQQQQQEQEQQMQ